MRMKEYLKGETVAAENCSMRGLCPVGTLCMAEDEMSGPPLFPTAIDINQGDMLWTDLRTEQRVFIVKTGVLSLVAHVSKDWETPFALYGSGAAIGLAELYVPRTTADTYHLKALVPGKVCSFLAKPLRRHLEDLPKPAPEKILSKAFVNMSAAALNQCAIMSKPSLRDRVALLLAILQNLAALSGAHIDVLHITHGEIAQHVMSDRGSVTRLLNKMEQEGDVELGYRSIKVNRSMRPGADEAADICSMPYPLG